MTDEEVDAAFDELGVVTLRAFMNDPDWLLLDEEELQSYARVAACQWYGAPVALKSGADLRQAVAEVFACRLYAVLTGEGVEKAEDGSESIPDMMRGGRIVLTPESVRHIEWMFRLMTDEPSAERYLAMVPEAMRTNALQQAGLTYELADLD